MIKVTGKNTFTADRDWLFEFCTCTDADTISFYNQENQILVSAQSPYRSVYYQQALTTPLSIGLGVNTQKLTKTVRHLRSGEVSFSFNSKKLKLQQDNVKVDYPIQDAHAITKIPQFVELTGEYKDSLSDSIVKTCALVPDSTKYMGVLLDVSDNTTKVFKLSALVARVFVHPPFLTACRFAIPISFSEILKKMSVSGILFSNNVIGVKSEKGTCCWVSLVHDGYPHDYLNYFKLQDNLQLVATTHVYVFDKDLLQNALTLVDAVIGDDGPDVVFTPAGYTNQGLLVWEISGKTIGHCTASERVMCQDSSKIEREPTAFKLKRKTLLSTIRTQDQNIYMYDLESFLLISNKERSDVSLLATLPV